MPHIDGTGPESSGPNTGRSIGPCSEKNKENVHLLGKGMSMRRNAGGGIGRGKRLRSGLIK